MARAALKWSLRDLATRAELSRNTVLFFEKGNPKTSELSIAHIRSAFAEAGIIFINGDTVTFSRLRKKA